MGIYYQCFVSHFSGYWKIALDIRQYSTAQENKSQFQVILVITSVTQGVAPYKNSIIPEHNKCDFYRKETHIYNSSVWLTKSDGQFSALTLPALSEASGVIFSTWLSGCYAFRFSSCFPCCSFF